MDANERGWMGRACRVCGKRKGLGGVWQAPQPPDSGSADGRGNLVERASSSFRFEKRNDQDGRSTSRTEWGENREWTQMNAKGCACRVRECGRDGCFGACKGGGEKGRMGTSGGHGGRRAETQKGTSSAFST